MHSLTPIMKKYQLRDNLQNNLILFKNVKVIKEKERLNKCYGLEVTKEK